MANLAKQLVDWIAEVPVKVNMLEAKSQLSRLVRQAVEGEEVVIASNGEPMVRLVPVTKRAGLRGWGRLKRFARDVDAAFSPEIDAKVSRMLKGRP